MQNNNNKTVKYVYHNKEINSVWFNNNWVKKYKYKFEYVEINNAVVKFDMLEIVMGCIKITIKTEYMPKASY